MKLAHLADIHLGFRQYYRQNAHGINQREADVAQAFAAAVNDVVASGPDLVVIAGDLFHSVRPPNPAILYAFNQFRRLRQELPQSPIVIVAGNHETPRSVETGTILKLFEALEGVRVVVDDAQELMFPDLDLSLMCVPHAALASGRASVPPPSDAAKHSVLVTHGEVAGALSRESAALEYGGMIVEPGDLRPEQWTYVALGHYHVARAVAPNAWYCGSLEYVSTNPWGEMIDEEREGRRGQKGWLMVHLGDEPSVEFRPIRLARAHVDLESIQGDGLGAADLDRLVSERVAAVPGGIADQVVRQVVFDVPRPIAREMNHERVRELKSAALHYNLDVRRPPAGRTVGVGAPGHRQTLAEMVRDFLVRRPREAEVDPKQLVALALKYLDDVETDLLED